MLLQWKYSVKIKSLFKITILIIFNSKAILVGQQFNKISDQQWKKFKKEPLQNLSQWRKRFLIFKLTLEWLMKWKLNLKASNSWQAKQSVPNNIFARIKSFKP